MARKWQAYYNNRQGWRPYSNQVGKKAVKRLLAEAREGSQRFKDGWLYKVVLVEE